MSIGLITTSTKKRNGIYCCLIDKTKYIVDILYTVITLLNNEMNLSMPNSGLVYLASQWSKNLGLHHQVEKLIGISLIGLPEWARGFNPLRASGIYKRHMVLFATTTKFGSTYKWRL